jgi:hypothetical protein
MCHLDPDAVGPYVHDGEWIDFQGLLAAREWSSTEDVIIRAAQSLWGGGRECGIGEACQERLDERHVRTILEAMAMRRGMQISFVETTNDPLE